MNRTELSSLKPCSRSELKNWRIFAAKTKPYTEAKIKIFSSYFNLSSTHKRTHFWILSSLTVFAEH